MHEFEASDLLTTPQRVSGLTAHAQLLLLLATRSTHSPSLLTTIRQLVSTMDIHVQHADLKVPRIRSRSTLELLNGGNLKTVS